MRKWLPLFICVMILLGARGGTVANAETAVSEGLIHDFNGSSLVHTDGSLWVWGGEHRSVPTELVGVEDVAATFDYRYFMKKDGTVWQWSLEGTSSTVRLTLVEGVRHVQSVLYVHNYELLLDSAGNVYKKQTDVETSVEAITGIDQVKAMTFYFDYQVGEMVLLFLKRDGTVWGSTDLLTFTPFGSLERIVAIGGNSAIRDDGTLWRWPDEYFPDGGTKTIADIEPTLVSGVNGIQTMTSNRGVYAGIDRDGRVWFWGSTITGWSDNTARHEQPAIRFDTISGARDVFFAERSLLVLTTSGELHETSIEVEKMSNRPAFRFLSTNVEHVEVGRRHVIFQKTDGSLWGWDINKGDYEYMHAKPVPVQAPIAIRLNGEPVAMMNGVILKEGQAFIPLRSVFEKLGAKVTWDQASRTAVISRPASGGEPALTISVNYKTGELKMNGEIVNLANAPFTSATSSYLPLRFISEQLGAKVDWDAGNQRIYITMT